MANKIAGKPRVNSIIDKFEAAGYSLTSWTEDGEYDSPKLELVGPAGNSILVAVEKGKICVTPWEGGPVQYKDYRSVAAYLLDA